MEVQQNEKGYVYILTNDYFKENVVKIGITIDLDQRLSSLDVTATPMPFNVYATLYTEKYKAVERAIHQMLDSKRIRSNREFFEIEPDRAYDVFLGVLRLLEDDAKLEKRNTDDGSIIDVTYSNDTMNTQQQHRAGTQKPPFRFSMVGIEPGEKILFVPANIEVEVADDRRIRYEDELSSLSAFCKKKMPEDKRNVSNAYQGPMYFVYKGETLLDRRLRMERMEEEPETEDVSTEIDTND